MSKSLDCSACGATVEKCDGNSVAVVCWDCLKEGMSADIPNRKKKSEFPRGWRFMKVYVHKDGKVYHKGIEQPELAGTLEPTTVEIKAPATKKSKAQRAQEKQETLSKLNKLKKALKNEKRKTYQKKLQTQISKLQRSV